LKSREEYWIFRGGKRASEDCDFTPRPQRQRCGISGKGYGKDPGIAAQHAHIHSLET